MPYWNYEHTKAVIYTVVKVGGGTGQDLTTEVTHLRLNQPPVFSSSLSLNYTLNFYQNYSAGWGVSKWVWSPPVPIYTNKTIHN